MSMNTWDDVYTKVDDTAVGTVYFTTPATNAGKETNPYRAKNMWFADGHKDFRMKKH